MKLFFSFKTTQFEELLISWVMNYTDKQADKKVKIWRSKTKDNLLQRDQIPCSTTLWNNKKTWSCKFSSLSFINFFFDQPTSNRDRYFCCTGERLCRMPVCSCDLKRIERSCFRVEGCRHTQETTICDWETRASIAWGVNMNITVGYVVSCRY